MADTEPNDGPGAKKQRLALDLVESIEATIISAIELIVGVLRTIWFVSTEPGALFRELREKELRQSCIRPIAFLTFASLALAIVIRSWARTQLGGVSHAVDIVANITAEMTLDISVLRAVLLALPIFLLAYALCFLARKANSERGYTDESMVEACCLVFGCVFFYFALAFILLISVGVLLGDWLGQADERWRHLARTAFATLALITSYGPCIAAGCFLSIAFTRDLPLTLFQRVRSLRKGWVPFAIGALGTYSTIILAAAAYGQLARWADPSANKNISAIACKTLHATLDLTEGRSLISWEGYIINSWSSPVMLRSDQAKLTISLNHPGDFSSIDGWVTYPSDDISEIDPDERFRIEVEGTISADSAKVLRARRGAIHFDNVQLRAFPDEIARCDVDATFVKAAPFATTAPAGPDYEIYRR